LFSLHGFRHANQRGQIRPPRSSPIQPRDACPPGQVVYHQPHATANRDAGVAGGGRVAANQRGGRGSERDDGGGSELNDDDDDDDDDSDTRRSGIDGLFNSLYRFFCLFFCFFVCLFVYLIVCLFVYFSFLASTDSKGIIIHTCSLCLFFSRSVTSPPSLLYILYLFCFPQPPSAPSWDPDFSDVADTNGPATASVASSSRRDQAMQQQPSSQKDRVPVRGTANHDADTSLPHGQGTQATDEKQHDEDTSPGAVPARTLARSPSKRDLVPVIPTHFASAADCAARMAAAGDTWTLSETDCPEWDERKYAYHDAMRLAETLAHNTTLRALTLDGLVLGVEGVAALGHALATNTTLTSLTVIGSDREVPASAAAFTAVAAAVATHRQLRQLTLERLPIGGLCFVELAEALQRQTSLTALVLRDVVLSREAVCLCFLSFVFIFFFLSFFSHFRR
jgi:hypothetical protein